jgi:hypothetical protein
MRVQQLVLFVSALAIGDCALQAAVAQESRGTEEQRMACTPDAWRLCGSEIPDVERIKSCLRANVPQLSAPCRAVFETTGSTDPRSRARRPVTPQQPYQQPYQRPYQQPYPGYRDEDE